VVWVKRRWECRDVSCPRKTFTESLPGIPVAHEAFARAADPLLGQPPALVAHLGIDEHRRGRPRWRADAETCEYVLLADR